MVSSCIEQTMVKEVGVREATGNNDGKRVGEYQKTTNNKAGDSWCASFVKWCFNQCGISTPITGWSPSAENRKNLVYKNSRFYQEPKTGDVFTVYSVSKKRIVHTGFYYKFYNSRIYESIEGNTSPSAVLGSKSDVNGNGVYKKLRSYQSTYSISRWFN